LCADKNDTYKRTSGGAKLVFDLPALLEQNQKRRLAASQLRRNISKLRGQAAHGGIVLTNRNSRFFAASSCRLNALCTSSAASFAADPIPSSPRLT
jgi:hypothetical protein